MQTPVDGCEIHFAAPKKPWHDDSPVNTNEKWFPMVSKWCRIVSIHSIVACWDRLKVLCLLRESIKSNVHEPTTKIFSIIMGEVGTLLEVAC